MKSLYFESMGNVPHDRHYLIYYKVSYIGKARFDRDAFIKYKNKLKHRLFK